MLQNTAVGAGGMGMGIAAAGAGPMMPSTYREGLGGMGGPQGGPSTPAGGGYQSPSGPEGAMGNMGDQRGKLTGDICLTVELSEVCTSAAMWIEERFQASRLALEGDYCPVAMVRLDDLANRNLASYLNSSSRPVGSAVPDKVAIGKAYSRGIPSKSEDHITPLPFLGALNSLDDSKDHFLLPLKTASEGAVSSTDLSPRNARPRYIPEKKKKKGTEEEGKKKKEKEEPTLSLKSILPEQLATMFLLAWAKQAESKKQELKDAAGPPKGRQKMNVKVKRQTISLVIPSYFPISQRAGAMTAAREAGLMVKHIFSRSLAACAASLMCSEIILNEKSLASYLESANKGSTEGQVVDTRRFLYVCANSCAVEASVVQAEGCREALRIGNRLGCMRLVAVANTGESTVELSDSQPLPLALKSGASEVILSNRICTLLESLLALPRVAAGPQPNAVLFSHCTPPAIKKCIQKYLDSQLMSGSASEAVSNSPIFIASTKEGDNARGGCYLAAAELDSSKQYIRLEDGGWTIGHSLPIGEDTVARSLYLRERSSPDETPTLTSLAAPGERLGKPDLGSVESNVQAGNRELPAVERKFEANQKTHLPGWPKVDLVEAAGEKGSHGSTGPEDRLQLLTSFEPLKAKDNQTKEDDIYEFVELAIRVDSALGVGGINVKKRGDPMRVKNSKSRSWYLGMLLLVALASLLGGSYYYFNIWSVNSIRATNEAWLRAFYSTYAPEKLDKVADTVAKYDGKMLQLWRSLERKYDIKLKPPPTIIDTDL